MWSATKDALSHEENPMLDTNICSFIMREQPAAVLKRPEQVVLRGDRIVVSAVTYAEMRWRHRPGRPRRAIFSWSTRSCARLDAILPWDRCGGRHDGHRVALRSPGRRSARTTRPLPATPSRPAPSWVTNNVREFERVPD